MSAFAFACQKALKAALLATAVVAERIYDDPPESVAFPWIEIGDGQVIPDDTSANIGTGSDDGVSEFFDLHVWSRYAGKKQAWDIVDALHTHLHGASLTIPGRASALAWIRNVRMLTDPDGLTRHGVVSLEIIHRS